MIHIAICDDSYSDTEAIETALLQLQPLFSEKLVTSIFYSGERFCETIKKNCPFDMVLMDIEMDGISGIEAGHRLRTDDENDMVLLIYISSHEDHYRQLLEVQPYAFIDKPIKQEIFAVKIKMAIKKIIKRRQDGKRRVLPVKQNGHEVLMSFRKILYFESRIRKILLHMVDEEIEYYGTLSGEIEKLNKIEFVRTHQSYIVNLRYVKCVTNDMLTLTDNSEIPISNNRKLSVKNAYMEYRRNYFE